MTMSVTMSDGQAYIAEQSTQDQHPPDDLEFLTNQLIELLVPEIDRIIAILRKLQLPLDGIPMPSEGVENARLEDENADQEEEQEEDKEEEEEEERKSGDLHLDKALVRLCRLDIEKSSTAEEATLYVTLIQVLEQLEMSVAADCLRKIADILRKQDEERSSSSEADLPQAPSTHKLSPGAPSLRCHRTLLRETLATIIDRLVITDTLLSILMKKSVINQHMVALVLSGPNRQQQVVQLIALLTQLGPYSLQVFIEALTETDNAALANVLKWSLRHAPQDIDD